MPRRCELVEGEDPAGKVCGVVLGAVEFGLQVDIAGFLPGAGALEGDAAAFQEQAQGFAADAEAEPGQVGGEFADGPAGEGPTELGRAGGGRRNYESFLVGAEVAGTASRPLRVHAAQPVDV